MKLNNENYFDIRVAHLAVGGKLRNQFIPKLEDCLKMQILRIMEGINSDIIIELNQDANCFINGKDEIAKQNLMKILPITEKDFLGKNLEDLLNFEFNLAERIN